MIRVVWICGLPEAVRTGGCQKALTSVRCAAWGWVLGHLPPPADVDLHIMCPVRNLIRDEVSFDYAGTHWHCFKELRGEQYIFRIPLILKMRKCLRKIQPNIVNGWGGETGCGWIATWLTRRPIVNVQGLLRLYSDMLKGTSWLSGRWIDRFLRRIVEVLTYRRAFVLFTESQLAHDALKKYYAHESTIIYQPLRHEFLVSQKNLDGNRDCVFLYVGAIEMRKGALDIIRAFSLICDSRVRLIMIGGGNQEDEVRTLAAKLGVIDRVEFRKGLTATEIITEMGQSEFYVLPSYGDTGPTTIKEALSQGLYPICYDNTGPKEHIERYHFGTLVPTGDWRAFARAMDEARTHRIELRRKGREVAKQIRRDLSPREIWPQIMAVYRRVAYA